jgi:hypothetical protein
MKVLRFLFSFMVLAALVASCEKGDSVPVPDVQEEVDIVQLLATQELSGPHYNLNIIGVPKDKTADMTDNSGHRIFVKLQGKSKILLSEGEEFQVLDANATKGPGEFQLPNPDPDNNGQTLYTVYARALGTPGGQAVVTTCATVIDEVTGEEEEMCSNMQYVGVRSSGKPRWDVADQLLYISVDLDGDGVDESYPLFSEELQDYFWDYDNNGLKLLQLRFYEVVE